MLVNNVGTNIRARCDESTPEQYRTMMSTNLDSAFFLSRALYAPLCKGSNASIVNVSSAAGGAPVPFPLSFPLQKEGGAQREGQG